MDKNNNIQVTISYRGTLDSGAVFDEIPDNTPRKVTLGSGALLPTLEEAIIGMLPGEVRTIQIPAQYGYGLHREYLVQSYPRTLFGNNISLEPGMILSQKVEKNGTMEQVPCTIISVDENEVKVDYNHPLAGQQLTYTITLHDID